MTVHTGRWPIRFTRPRDCAYCIDGYIPATHHILGHGYVRCPRTQQGTRPCCDLATFYPIGSVDDLHTWARSISVVYQLIPVLCSGCFGVTELEPVPDQWGNQP